MKRSPKRTANCALAMDHSRGGMIHCFSERFKTRKRSLVAASSPDAVLEEAAARQARPLEEVYPLIFFDALRVKIRDEWLVRQQGGAYRAGRTR